MKYNIADFIKIKEYCAFCHSKLNVSLTSFNLGPFQIPLFYAKLKDNQFNFTLNQTTKMFSLSAKINLNINSKITFTIPDYTEDFDYVLIKTCFADHKPHLELYCSNKICKMRYVLSSDLLHCSNYFDELNYDTIKPFNVYMESFIVDKMWIQNDWINSTTNIYVKNNMEIEPLKTKILDLNKMNKEKVINRIRNIVTFT